MLAAILALVMALLLPSRAWAVVKGMEPYGPAVPTEEQEEDAQFYGYRPLEYQTQSIHDQNYGGYSEYAPRRAGLPSAYSTRTTGQLTPVKDQQPFGACWTFSVMAASESSVISRGEILQGTTPDFSERQLAFFTYNPVNDPLGNLEGDTVALASGLNYLNSGGNERYAAYTLSSWSGVVDESIAPYSELVEGSHVFNVDDYALDSGLSRGIDIAHLTDMRQIPLTDRDDVKRAIMEFGAVDASLFFEDDCYNEENNALYNDWTTETNHAIALVGWDDTFSRFNFGQSAYDKPEGTIDAPSSYQELLVDSSVNITGSYEGEETNWLVFEPPVTGEYTVFTSDCEGEPQFDFYHLDESNGLLNAWGQADPTYDGDNVSLTARLKAGQTYYIACRSDYIGASTSFTVNAEFLETYDGPEVPGYSIEIIEDNPTTVAGGDWIRFIPSVSGAYTFQSSESGNSYPKAVLYEMDAQGCLVMANYSQESLDGGNFSFTGWMVAGRTYYLECDSWSYDDPHYTVTVSADPDWSGDWSTGTVDPPESSRQLTMDDPQQVLINCSTVEWLHFTPSKDGMYEFGGSGVGGVDIRVYGIDSSNGKIGLVGRIYGSTGYDEPEPYSFQVGLRADTDYYVKCSAGGGQSYSISVSYAGEPSFNGPSEDGAWLVRNSWGEEWGDEGYFWVSYEDTSLNGSADNPGVASTFEYDAADNYDNIYQYDGTPCFAYTVVGSGGSLANIFEAKGNAGGVEQLKAVSFWMEDVNVDYSVQIYTDLADDDDPTSGTPALSSPVTGKTDYAGYYTIELPQEVELADGEKYAVVVTVSHADDSYVMFGFDESADNEWVMFTSTALPGQSFAKYSSDEDWCDTSSGDWADIGNVRIKAFTTNGKAGEAASLSSATVTCSPTLFVYSGSENQPSVTVVLAGKTLQEGTDFTVSYSNNINAGTAFAIVKGVGSYSGSASTTFTIERATASIPTEITGLVYTGELQRGVDFGNGIGFSFGGDYVAINAGSYNAFFNLQDNYNWIWSDGSTDTKEVNWSIAPASIAGASFASIENQVYTGLAITPALSATFGSKTLIENRDYTVEFTNNTGVGTATALVTGKGNFTGTTTLTFQIVEEGETLSGTWGTCPWDISNGVLTVHPGVGASQAGSEASPWDDYADSITSVVFAAEGGRKVELPEDSSFLLANLGNVVSVDTSGLDISSVKNMRCMFYYCSALTSVDVSSWDISGVTSIRAIFSQCSSLTSIDVSGWDTSNVTSMRAAFHTCSSLDGLDVSGWDTSKVTDMYSMFYGCSSLDELDVSGWNTSKVIDMTGMFSSCSALRAVDISGWDTSKVTDMTDMFDGCSSLAVLDVSSWDTSSVTNMYGMFSSCSSLTSLDVSSWDTSKVTDMCWMFGECTSLDSLDVSSWDTSNVTNFGALFYNCSSLGTLDVSGWNTSKVENMEWMFGYCSKLSLLDLSGWDTSSNASTEAMFYGCSGLTTIYAGDGWTTSSVTKPGSMFQGCTSLVGGNGTAYDANHVDAEYARIDASGAPGYFSAKPADLIDISAATVDAIADQTYDGTAKRPAVTVRLGGSVLAEGTDFTVAYSSNVNAGFATVTVTGKGVYTGTKTAIFTIAKADIATATIASIPDQAYTGSAITPAVTVRLGDTALKAGTDYTVSYSNNTAVGTATVTVTGRGNFSGTKTATFRIVDDPPAPENPFVDVNERTGHFEDILWLADAGISRGWPDGTFRPYANVARADMAAFLCRLVNGSGYTYRPTADDWAYFSDVNPSTPHAEDILWMAHMGISRGWTEKDGSHTFRPYANVARCDMACFLMRMALGSQAEEGYVPSDADLAYFSDVNERTSHRNAVLWLAHEGISAGWTEKDGSHTFRPYANVARADMAAFLHRMEVKGLVPEDM